MTRKRARVLIEGRVQGVFFRDSTRREALRLGLHGWVRNQPAGAVEALFEGEATQVERMIAWCHRGSPMASVSSVLVREEEPQGETGAFVIRY